MGTEVERMWAELLAQALVALASLGLLATAALVPSPSGEPPVGSMTVAVDLAVSRDDGRHARILAPALAIVPPASTPTAAQTEPVNDTATSRGELALARLPIQPSAVGFTISFEPPSPTHFGLTYPDRRHIEIYVDAAMSDGQLAHVVAHEVGHAIDMVRNDGQDQIDWRELRGFVPATKWWADAYTSDFATPSGDFAECFAVWAVGARSRSTNPDCSGTAEFIAAAVAG